jgi:hypothetical protein
MRSHWMIQRADRYQRNSLLYTSTRLKTFNARMKLRSAMIAVSAMTSVRMRAGASQRSIAGVPLEDDESRTNDDDAKKVEASDKSDDDETADERDGGSLLK